MTTLLIALAFIAGAVVCWFLITSYVGRNVPNSIKGCAYLKSKLQESGFDISTIPNGCLDEIVSIAEKSARVMTYANQGSFLSVFSKNLDDMVPIFWLWKSNPEDSLFSYRGMSEKNLYRDIFERYNI